MSLRNLTLRPVSRADAAELIQSNIESQAYHAPWLKPLIDRAAFESWYARQVTGSFVSLVARDVATSAIVGVVSFSQIIYGLFQNSYLGYYGMVDFAGRGLMTEAVREAARYGFTELGLHRLEANIQPANLRSIALVRRLGFRKEGFSQEYLFINDTWCDCERWALLAREMPESVHA